MTKWVWPINTDSDQVSGRPSRSSRSELQLENYVHCVLTRRGRCWVILLFILGSILANKFFWVSPFTSRTPMGENEISVKKTRILWFNFFFKTASKFRKITGRGNLGCRKKNFTAPPDSNKRQVSSHDRPISQINYPSKNNWVTRPAAREINTLQPTQKRAARTTYGQKKRRRIREWSMVSVELLLKKLCMKRKAGGQDKRF